MPWRRHLICLKHETPAFTTKRRWRASLHLMPHIDPFLSISTRFYDWHACLSPGLALTAINWWDWGLGITLFRIDKNGKRRYKNLPMPHRAWLFFQFGFSLNHSTSKWSLNLLCPWLLSLRQRQLMEVCAIIPWTELNIMGTNPHILSIIPMA